MLELISNNPFRILGTPVNSSLKERITNLNRFKAFQKVSKSVETSMDFDVIFGSSPLRNKESLDQAQRELDLPVDQLKWSLFWVANSTSAETISLKNLSSGNIEKAISIVSKFSNWSSLLNYSTLSLIKGDYSSASKIISELLSEHRLQFLKGIGCEVLDLSYDQIIIIYFRELTKYVSSIEVIKTFKGLQAYNVLLPIVSEELISEISRHISVASSTEKEDSLKNLSAGKELIRVVSPLLQSFKEIVDDSSSFGIIARVFS